MTNKSDEIDALSWKALEYIGDVTANAKCPFCGGLAWAYTQDEDGSVRRSLISYAKKPILTVLPAIPLTCETCGFIRHHDLAMIKTKLDEKSDG